MRFGTSLLIFTILFSVSFISAQEKLIEKGDASFAKLAYADAITYYLQAIEEGATSVEMYKKLGDAYYFNSDLAKANQIYTILFDTEKPEDPEYFFRYAQTLKAVEKYGESDRVMAEFRSMTGSDSRGIRFSGSRDYLDSIKTNMLLYDVKALRINSGASDFAPTMLADELVFSSSRDSSGRMARFRARWNNEAFLDIYITEDRKDSMSREVKNFSKRINTKFHESTSVFTKDGNTMYFTRNDFSGGKLGVDRTRTTRLKIYKSVKSGKKWSKPKELPFNDRGYSVAHPALSPDETKLYFASDMPGTLGASDLWVVDIFENGAFSQPRNLGPTINTEAKETFPFVGSSNNLYFASDGHVGLGGLDIFVSKVNDDNSFGEVINVGKPINGPTDDFTFIVDEEKRTGYFASNRKGGKGSDDIYIFRLKPNEIIKLEQLVMGLVTDADTNQKIVGAKVILYDKELQPVKDTITDKLGIYETKVAGIDKDEKSVENTVQAEYEGYMPAKETFLRTKDIDTFYINLQLRKIKEPEIGEDLAKVLQLKPIYFNFDKANIRYDAKIELDKIVALMKMYPEIIIDVKSHTDSRGRSAYNLALSNKRARATVKYITQKGVDISRISGKGYGESQLVNNCTNGVRCKVHQHQLNRRSEFIVVKNAGGGAIVKSSDILDTSEFVTGRPGSNSGTFVNYDFNSANKTVVYTVQIGALRGRVQSTKYDRLTDLFNHRYKDGFNRYFSGMFSTPTEARNYMKRLRQRGFEGAFVVGLKGETRF